MADNPFKVSATIAAQNTGTDWLGLQYGGKFDISVKSLSASTIHLQRKRPGEADAAARDIGDAITADTQEVGEVAGHWLVRLFCKTGNYGSDSPVLELSR